MGGTLGMTTDRGQGPTSLHVVRSTPEHRLVVAWEFEFNQRLFEY